MISMHAYGFYQFCNVWGRSDKESVLALQSVAQCSQCLGSFVAQKANFSPVLVCIF